MEEKVQEVVDAPVVEQRVAVPLGASRSFFGRVHGTTRGREGEAREQRAGEVYFEDSHLQLSPKNHPTAWALAREAAALRGEK